MRDFSIISDEEKLNIRDDYDLYELASKVHFENADMLNRDFTLAWTNKGLEEWAIKQKILALDFFNVLKNVDMEIAQELRILLDNEIKDRLIFTRSREGRVLKGFLKREQEIKEKEKVGALKSLFMGNKKKNDEQEED